jgi:LysR family transcriptional regulator, transcriptional activator for bauABCD operon
MQSAQNRRFSFRWHQACFDSFRESEDVLVVSDIDVRLLRVFRAVVESGGFANAQAILNVGASTISTQMSQLETRLGYVLCHRGRGGFKLTANGEALYRLVVQLFNSVQSFEMQARELKGALDGLLRVGFLDNIISDPASPLREAVRKFRSLPRNCVRLVFDVLSPHELERGLLERRIDAAVGIFYSRLPGLTYETLYTQREVLLCHKDHELARVGDPAELVRRLPDANKVVRAFIGTSEFPFSMGQADTLIATINHIEATTLLILTGDCIGFLPKHYAQSWIDQGELIELMPDKIFRDTPFSIATPANTNRPAAILHTFLECLRSSTTERAASPRQRLSA